MVIEDLLSTDWEDLNKLAPEQEWLDHGNRFRFIYWKQYGIYTRPIDLETEEKFLWSMAVEKIMATRFFPQAYAAYCDSHEADVQSVWTFHEINTPPSRNEEPLITHDPHGLELRWLAE